MTAAALLHDFAPDGFHGALGPERVVLPGDGRVVLAEHVLGTVVEGAEEAWGIRRLWKEYRIATLPGAGSAQHGRRVDVLQIGLIALALCLGRPLGDEDYPDQVGWLLARATEKHGGPRGRGTQAGIAHVVRAQPLASEATSPIRHCSNRRRRSVSLRRKPSSRTHPPSGTRSSVSVRRPP